MQRRVMMALAVTGILAAGAARADDNPVVLKVNGHEYHRSDVTDFIAGLDPQVQQVPPELLFGPVLDQLIARQLLADAAIKNGLDADPGVQRRIAQARDTVLQEAFLTHEVNLRVTDEMLRAKYEEAASRQKPEREIHARHILLDNEQEARDVIAQLDKGADFAELAKAHSTGPTGPNGGDLGWFSAGDMVPEFSAAAFATAPGTYAPAPVKTEFGWHVIKVEEERTKELPPFDQVKEQLKSAVSQEMIKTVIDDMRQGAQIEQFDFNGKPVTAEAPAGGGNAIQ